MMGSYPNKKELLQKETKIPIEKGRSLEQTIHRKNSVPFIIRETQIKITMRYHSIPTECTRVQKDRDGQIHRSYKNVQMYSVWIDGCKGGWGWEATGTFIFRIGV